MRKLVYIKKQLLVEIGDNFLENVIDTSFQLAKHRSGETLTSSDVNYALCKLKFSILVKNFDYSDNIKSNDFFNKLKENEARHYSTPDHKKRVELTREECKNIN